METRFFRLSGVWFLGGLLTGLWMLGLYPLAGGRALLPAAAAGYASFATVRSLHVSWLVLGWLGMLAAGVVVRLGARGAPIRTATPLWLWMAWGCAAAPVYLLGAGPRWTLVWQAAYGLAWVTTLLVAFSGRVRAPARWIGPGALGILVVTWLVAPASTAHAAALQLPPLAQFEAVSALLVAACAWALLGRQHTLSWAVAGLGWAAAIWLGHRLPSEYFAALVVASLWAVDSVRRSASGHTAYLLTYAVVVTAATALAPVFGVLLTPLAVAANLSSVAVAAVYLLAPGVPAGSWHWLSHVLGFSGLVAGLQAAAVPGGTWLTAADAAVTWGGALAVAVGASFFVLSLNRRPAAASAGSAAESPMPAR